MTAALAAAGYTSSEIEEVLKLDMEDLLMGEHQYFADNQDGALCNMQRWIDRNQEYNLGLLGYMFPT